MFKRMCCVLSLLFLVSILTGGCASEKAESVPVDMEEYYNQFIETFTTGTYEDLAPFLHFEIAEYQEMTEKFYCNISNAHVENWEKIQDNLWVANTHVESAEEPEGLIAHYFVGRIDGELRVMIGVFQVPEDLAGDADLSRFIAPDTLIPGQFVLS